MSNQVTVSDAVARPLRTAGQHVPAVVITDVIDTFIYDFDDRGYGVFLAALTLFIGWAQTGIENWRGKGFLREVPSPQVPVMDPDIEDVQGRHEA
jgi:hypothetical protein